MSTNGFVQATGSWKRIDKDEALTPTTVTIQCSAERKQCIEAYVHLNDLLVSAPDVSTFDATFTPQAVSYENNNAVCAGYSVRIDLKMEKVFALRARKMPGDKRLNGFDCERLEPRVEMQLADGWRAYQPKSDWKKAPLVFGMLTLPSPLL
jgi:hypothetical protein